MIGEARRFYQMEQITEFMLTSNYRPEIYGLEPSDFEVAEVEITYRELKTVDDS